MSETQLLEVELEGGAKAAVHRFTVRESLSKPFEVELVVRKSGDPLRLDTIVGKPATFTMHNMAASAQRRVWKGVVAQMGLTQSESEGVSTYALRLVPRLWLLSQRVDCRVFQRETLPDIVEKVLGEWQIETKRQLAAKYKQLDFVVQWEETDLQFVSRLLERAGITYALDADGVMVLDDAPHTRAPRDANLRYNDNPVESAAREFATKVRLAHVVETGLYTLRDYDFRRPVDQQFFRASDPMPPGEKYETYAYDIGSTKHIGVRDGEGTPTQHADDKARVRHSPSEGKDTATRRMEAERRGRRRVRFVTNCADLLPATIVSMDAHPRKDLSEPMLVTSLEMAGVANDRWTFVAESVFTDLPHRPLLETPRPRIQGVQSAVVVGPANKELHTDEFGRVRVRFHWDRGETKNDDSSCWIRVSQEWAGALFGSIMIPRVGQEVLVGFLDGNPDEPVIVGRVYNQTNAVPYPLPRFSTRSGLKTDTTPGSGGFNEILMEDRIGYEVLYLQAQKDMLKLVKREETERVKVNKTEIVGKDRTSLVRTVDATMVGKMSTWQVISSTNKDELKIMDQQAPSPKPTKTQIQMTDGRVIFTTGDASVVFDGGTIAFEAKGDIYINAKGGDVTLEGSRAFINTIGPSAAASPDSLPRTEMGTFSSIEDRDPPP